MLLGKEELYKVVVGPICTLPRYPIISTCECQIQVKFQARLSPYIDVFVPSLNLQEAAA